MVERLAGLVGLMALVLVGSAQADPAPAPGTPDHTIRRPIWQKTPQASELEKVYPDRPLRLGRGGSALIECHVRRDGTLFDCVIVSEQPANEDFGPAALKLAPYFQMSPQTAEGQSVEGGTVRIPIVFNIEPDFPPPDNGAEGVAAFERGEICFNENGEDAIRMCTWVIQSGLWSPPRLGWAYARRGNLNSLLGRTGPAIADLTQAVSRDPTNAAAFIDRGQLYEKLGRRDAAIADYRAALKANPDLKEAAEGLKRLKADP